MGDCGKLPFRQLPFTLLIRLFSQIILLKLLGKNYINVKQKPASRFKGDEIG